MLYVGYVGPKHEFLYFFFISPIPWLIRKILCVRYERNKIHNIMEHIFNNPRANLNTLSPIPFFNYPNLVFYEKNSPFVCKFQQILLLLPLVSKICLNEG